MDRAVTGSWEGMLKRFVGGEVRPRLDIFPFRDDLGGGFSVWRVSFFCVSFSGCLAKTLAWKCKQTRKYIGFIECLGPSLNVNYGVVKLWSLVFYLSLSLKGKGALCSGLMSL